MKAGYAFRDITPEEKYPMAGFDLRTEVSAGAHDPLFVRALSIEDTVRKLIIVYDLLGIGEDMAAGIRKKIEERLGIVSDAVQVCATHTHAAPRSIFVSAACFDRQYRDIIEDLGVEAAREAVSSAAEAEVEVFEGTVKSVGSFRDEKRGDSEFDMPCDVLKFSVKDADPILLMTYNCHPTVLNEKNLMYSKDLVYGCDKYIKNAVPNARTLYLNGACGDISTRYTRIASTFDDAERIGAIWGEKVVSMLNGKSESGTGVTPAISGYTELYIPPAVFFKDDERKEIVEYLNGKIEKCADPEQKREYISCRSVLVRERYGKDASGKTLNGKTVRISTMNIGRAVFVFIPFEYSQRDAACLKRDVKAGLNASYANADIPVEIIGYSNGYEGYLPSGRPVDRDSGYMDMSSGFFSGAKDLLAAKVTEMLG